MIYEWDYYFIVNDPLRIMMNYTAGAFFGYFSFLAIRLYKRLKDRILPELKMCLIGLHVLFACLALNRLFWAVARHCRYENVFDYGIFEIFSSIHVLSLYVAVCSVAVVLAPVKAAVSNEEIKWNDIYRLWALITGVLILGAWYISN